MERVELYCEGRRSGEIILRPDGGRTEVSARMDDPEDGLYRASLHGERGDLALGVMAPDNGSLALTRRIYTRDIAALGALRCGEAKRSFRFQEDPSSWKETSCPAQLFHNAFLQSRLRPWGKAWWRMDGERLLLAIPLEDGKPFPLEALFCLAKIERIHGAACAVFVFLREEPVVP